MPKSKLHTGGHWPPGYTPPPVYDPINDYTRCVDAILESGRFLTFEQLKKKYLDNQPGYQEDKVITRTRIIRGLMKSDTSIFYDGKFDLYEVLAKLHKTKDAVFYLASHGDSANIVATFRDILALYPSYDMHRFALSIIKSSMVASAVTYYCQEAFGRGVDKNSQDILLAFIDKGKLTSAVDLKCDFSSISDALARVLSNDRCSDNDIVLFARMLAAQPVRQEDPVEILQIACNNKLIHTVQELLKLGLAAIPEYKLGQWYPTSAILLTVRNNRAYYRQRLEDVAEWYNVLVREYRVNIDVPIPELKNDTVLHQACRHGYTGLVKTILDDIQSFEKAGPKCWRMPGANNEIPLYCLCQWFNKLKIKQAATVAEIEKIAVQILQLYLDDPSLKPHDYALLGNTFSQLAQILGMSGTTVDGRILYEILARSDEPYSLLAVYNTIVHVATKSRGKDDELASFAQWYPLIFKAAWYSIKEEVPYNIFHEQVQQIQTSGVVPVVDAFMSSQQNSTASRFRSSVAASRLTASRSAASPPGLVGRFMSMFLNDRPAVFTVPVPPSEPKSTESAKGRGRGSRYTPSRGINSEAV